jgi:hypothetical protein
MQTYNGGPKSSNSPPKRPEPDRPPSAPPSGAPPESTDAPDAKEDGTQALYDELFGTPALETETPMDVFVQVVQWVRRRPALLGTIRAALRVGERLYYRDHASEIAPERGGPSG